MSLKPPEAVQREPGWTPGRLAQRVGWAIGASIIVASIWGVFGRGPVSHREARSADGALKVRYEHFVRHDASMKLNLTIDNPQARETHVWIDIAYFDHIRIKSVVPEPIRFESEPGKLIMVFGTPDMDGGPLDVVIWCRVTKMGAITGRIGVSNSAESAASIQHFAYP